VSRTGSGSRGLTAVAVVALAIAVIGAAVAPSAGAVAPNPNPWLQERFLNMAHQGGEDEAPSSTMFAFKSAMRDRGADSLELDVNLSSDGQLMVIHDDTWTRTACTAALCPGPDASSEPVRPASEVNDLTAAQLQALDAGYWFRPGTYSHDYGQPGSAYPYRGIRTGAVPPPPGYSADDFEIPTLRQVLDEFPSTPINIEIKMIKTLQPLGGNGCVGSFPNTYCDDPAGSMPVADALADLLDEPQYASRTDIIVVSFADQLIDEFHAKDDPPFVALAPGTGDTTAFALLGGALATPSPDVAAFQVPPEQSGVKVPEVLLQTQHAHELGYAVHVFTNGDQDETDASYSHLYNLGVDGIMSSVPSRLTAFLCANQIPRPDGSSHCEPAGTTPPPGGGGPSPPGTTPPPAGTVSQPPLLPSPPAIKKCGKGKHRKGGHCVAKHKKHKRR
jgi:glycerophosphoryl diester phosphodiesterase